MIENIQIYIDKIIGEYLLDKCTEPITILNKI